MEMDEGEGRIVVSVREQPAFSSSTPSFHVSNVSGHKSDDVMPI